MKQNQASGLEDIMEPQSIFNKRGKTKFVAITSGKGGVGKSTISANLAYSLFKAGYKVGVLDADIGLANLDIIFGIKTTKNILHALRGEAHFSEVVYPIEEGFYLVPGDSGEEIFKYVSQDILDSFVDEENLLDDLDYMIIDTGAGIGEFTQAFLRASDCVVVITTSDPAAITDAYTTIKVNSKTKDDAFVLVNMVDSAEKGLQIFGGIQRVAKENIPNMTLNYLGYIQNNNAVKRSIKDRKLLCKSEPFNAFSFSMNQIVKILTMKIEQGVLETPKDNFIGFFIGLILSLLKFDQPEYILFGTLTSTVGFYLIILFFASIYMGFVSPRKKLLNKADLERKLVYFNKEFVQREREIEDLLNYVRNYEYNED